MMNYFRTLADLLHLLSFFIIIFKLITHRNCKGVSAKTQEIYLLVFCARYLDLFMYMVSLYNTTMKIAFISATFFILFLMKYKSPICSVSTIYTKLYFISIIRPTTAKTTTSHINTS